jgi:N-acetyl-gamma-glutamyl-phosphate reductase
MKKKLSIGIIGASGYTASELIRLIYNHPHIEINFLCGNSKAGQEITNIYPHLKFIELPVISDLANISYKNIDLIFTCLPHGETANIIANIPDNIRIIDLSSDFRITSDKIYSEYYGKSLNNKYQSETAYGLSEIFIDNIKNKRIIACPGCYSTAALLPLYPLIHNNKISKEEIIIDAKTGISGAGRKEDAQNLFCEINENLLPYNINKHRHLAELIEKLNISKDNIQFTPQIIPLSRGINSNIYVNSSHSSLELSDFLTDFYAKSPFIKITKDIPKLRNVIATNYCEIAIFDTNIKNKKLIISNIDNLTKGSSGQALQNLNIIYGFEHNIGLNNLATYP